MTNPLAVLRMLVVDDNPQMRTIVGTVLHAAGVQDIHFAGDGRQALELLRGSDFDCIYVDFEMPQMNGIQFVQAMRQLDRRHRFTPVIMLTGYADRAHLTAARDSGVNEFLRKPVTARDILLRLEAVILRPRQFVTSPDYFGPDRRRTRATAYLGTKRRAKDRGEMVEL
ncbi:MAG TPA: response regulator [Caulobacteraceae bacterium]|nr:response regulator [Caulobacteraceae bacterium]